MARLNAPSPTWFSASVTGPQGGSLFKRGVHRVTASLRFSAWDFPSIEVEAYRDVWNRPCVRVLARLSGDARERVFYEGPLSADLVFAPDPVCPECEDRGWEIFNEREEDGYLGEVQACDCGFLGSDDEALAAARSDGWTVSDDYAVIAPPVESSPSSSL
jgi:hypothetical protein